MNTADRSLAMVDYALRRRFAFFDVPPAFGQPGLARKLSSLGVEDALRDRIIGRFEVLNNRIREDHEVSSDPAWLPEMRADVMLTDPSRRVAIEIEYYAAPYQSHHGSKKLISSHLYQLLAYVAHLRAVPAPEPIGVLLYAAAGHEQRLQYRLDGNQVIVRSIDLDRDWRDIHCELLALVAELREEEVRAFA